MSALSTSRMLAIIETQSVIASASLALDEVMDLVVSSAQEITGAAAGVVELIDGEEMRAARREALVALGLRDRRSGWPLEMVLRAAAAGWRIDEVRVTYRARNGGRSKVSGSVRGSLQAVHDMAQLRSVP